MLKKIIIVAVVFTLVFMIPVTVAGAIVNDPIGFIGEIIFGEGDTDKVSNEVKNLYEEFIKSEIGRLRIKRQNIMILIFLFLYY